MRLPPLLLRVATAAVAAVVLSAPAARCAPARKPARKPVPRRSPAPPATRGAAAAVTQANLGATLKSLGYAPTLHGQYQRLQVDEGAYGYLIDLSLSQSGDWLVCMAHLAPIEDLTKVKSAPLLNLLSTNDALLGMYFSYDKVNARIMLNASVPTRALAPVSVRSLVEGLKETVRQTRGLWDSTTW